MRPFLLLSLLCTVAVRTVSSGAATTSPSLCADGSTPVQCFQDPCNTVDCPAASTCVANYCGGCNAQCVPNEGSQNQCTSDEQCTDGYCLEGTCKQNGQCNVKADCENPSNVWPHILCTGDSACVEGRCNWICGPENPSDPSCATILCAEGTFCQNGQCLPQTGSQQQDSCAAVLCPVNTVCEDGQCVAFSCSDEKSCAAGYTCGPENTCIDLCTITLCPANTECILGQCVPFTCSSDDQCVDGYTCSPEGRCLDKCATVRCRSGTKCRDGKCVDAHPFCYASRIRFFDRPCRDSSQYCSTSRRCLDDGTCSSVADCSNPDNNFIQPLCVGYFRCENNQCNKYCGDDPATIGQQQGSGSGNGGRSNGGGNGNN